MESLAMGLVDGYYERVSKRKIAIVGKIVRLGSAGGSTSHCGLAMRAVVVLMTLR